MNPILRNIIAIIVGWIGGSTINMGLIQVGYLFFPIEGVNINDMEAFAAVMPTLGSEHFIFPFLGHALGTLAGALIAGLVAANHKMKFSMAIGGLFLVAGIIVNYILRGPIWFAVLDVLIAYLPMAWIGGTVAGNLSKGR